MTVEFGAGAATVEFGAGALHVLLLWPLSPHLEQLHVPLLEFVVLRFRDVT